MSDRSQAQRSTWDQVYITRREWGRSDIRSDHRNIKGEGEGSWRKNSFYLTISDDQHNRWLEHMKFRSQGDCHVPQRKENGIRNPQWKVQEELRWAEHCHIRRPALLPHPPSTPSSTSLMRGFTVCTDSLKTVPQDHPAGAKKQSHRVSFSYS